MTNNIHIQKQCETDRSAKPDRVSMSPYKIFSTDSDSESKRKGEAETEDLKKSKRTIRTLTKSKMGDQEKQWEKIYELIKENKIEREEREQIRNLIQELIAEVKKIKEQNKEYKTEMK